MEPKEFTVEIFEKALKIYRELPEGEESLIIEALSKINKLSFPCKVKSKEMARRRAEKEVKESSQ